jgi:uncharacterized lipoprotein YddW (UPF0748 family)
MKKKKANQVSCKVSRRDFIKTSAAVSLSALLPGTNYVFAQGGPGGGGLASRDRQEFGLAVWSHKLRDFGSKDEVESHAKRLAGAAVDILIPIVKGTNGAVDFLTGLADVNPEYPDWDPLKVLIEACRRRGVKVHPWFCVFTEGGRSRLLREHPQFVAKGTGGRNRWACAMRPEVQDYEFGLYKSVAESYKPDGLHLDYIRTGGVCRCEFCKAQMKKKGIDIDKVKPSEPAWIEWRISRLMQFVRRLREFTKKEKMELSAAVFRGYSSARISQAQDWVKWAEEGIVDYLMPMNYTNDLSTFKKMTESHIGLVRGRVPVWEGIGKKSSMSKLSTQALVEQAQAAGELGTQGVVIFNYGAMTDDDFKAIREVKERAGGGVDFTQVGGAKVPLVFKADFEDGSLDAWQATDPAAWQIEEKDGDRVLALFKQSKYSPKVRSPLNINLIKDVVVGSFVLELKMLSTTKDYGHRDMCLFFGHQGPSHFYYVHIANQSDAHANSIFIVDDKPRVSIAKTRTAGTKWDDKWHTVRLVRDAEKGTIEVFFDNRAEPIMTAVDKRFAWGRVGVGSFDDTGCYDNIRLWGRKVKR